MDLNHRTSQFSSFMAGFFPIVSLFIKVFIVFNTNPQIVCRAAGHLCESNLTKDDYGDSLFDVTGYPLTGDLPLLNRKIFRGKRVNIREHPYIVSVRRNNCHYLTGSLITKNLVLTVAHPIVGVPVQQLKIVLGENYSDRGTSLLTVILVVVHQDFNSFTLVADLAMIRFYEDITFKSSIKGISLIAPNLQLSNKTAFVTGWGRCDLTGKELCLPRSSAMFPDELMDPMLRSISFTITSPNLYCDGYKNHGTAVRTGMLCTGSAREEHPSFSCLAVPGAPLAVNAKLVGLLSWGFGCGYMHDLPLVYTSIQYYTIWIAQNVKLFHGLTKDHVSQLFEATKSFTILEWLESTRVIKPKHHDHGNNYKDLHPLEIDETLSQLQGNLYDIRDFIKEENLYLKKKLMYQVIKKAQNKSRYHKNKLLENSIQFQKLRGHPFMNKSLLLSDTGKGYENANEDSDY